MPARSHPSRNRSARASVSSQSPASAATTISRAVTQVALAAAIGRPVPGSFGQLSGRPKVTGGCSALGGHAERIVKLHPRCGRRLQGGEQLSAPQWRWQETARTSPRASWTEVSWSRAAGSASRSRPAWRARVHGAFDQFDGDRIGVCVVERLGGERSGLCGQVTVRRVPWPPASSAATLIGRGWSCHEPRSAIDQLGCAGQVDGGGRPVTRAYGCLGRCPAQPQRVGAEVPGPAAPAAQCGPAAAALSSAGEPGRLPVPSLRLAGHAAGEGTVRPA